MLTDTEQGLLELDEKVWSSSNEFNTDLIIQAFVNEEGGRILTCKNFKDIVLKIKDFLQQEYDKLNTNLAKIIEDRATHEIEVLTIQANAQFTQKKAELQQQYEQECNTKKSALEQEVNSNVFTSQADADSTVAIKNAEFQSFTTSYIQQSQNLLDDYRNTVEQEAQKEAYAIKITELKVRAQQKNAILAIANSKLSSLTTELGRLAIDDYNIELAAIEDYNKTWLSALLGRINLFANMSINELESETINVDNKTFEQFLEETGKKEILIQKNYLNQLISDVHSKNYAPPTDYLEKLFLIIEDPRCSKLHDSIMFILWKSTINVY